MDRRAFLTAKRKTLQRQPDTVKHIARTMSGLTPYSGPWDTEAVVHLLKRTMFGATPQDIAHFKGMSMSQAVDELLNPAAALPSPPLKDYDTSKAMVPDSDIAPGATWVNSYSADPDIHTGRRESLLRWNMGALINQDRSIREKLGLFWKNHFSTETTIISDPHLLYKQYSLFRTSALGNFKKFVRDVTLDPGMLIYLNGYLNSKGAPDENYGRELQELFTLGKTNNPNYTEDDVKAAAKVLTGWRVDAPLVSYHFDATEHDTSSKQFSSFYGGTVIPGGTGDTELDAMLTMIFNKKAEVSQFIVRKIYRWFCYYTIDSTAEANVILPLAQIFQDNNWEIKPVLDALFKSEHFFDDLNRGCLIKSPLDHSIALLREYAVAFPDLSTDYKSAYEMYDFVNWENALENQSYGDPPSVSGWPAYYQAPQFHELWINSDTLPKRNQFSDILIDGYTRGSQTIKIDPIAFAKQLSNPGDPNVLITDSLAILYRVPVLDTTRDKIKTNLLLTNQTSDYYWTNAWNAYLASPTDTMAYQTVYVRLRDLYRYLMNLAEYQLS